MLNRTLVGLGLSLALYAGCTSSDSDSNGGGGVGVVDDGDGTAGGGNGNDGGGGGSGLPECSLQGLNPPSGPYACGSVGCEDGTVCVESERFPGSSNNCLVHFCAAVPPACEGNPTCACLADFIDYAVAPAPTCSDAGGKLKLTGEDLWNPPWTEPACPGSSCLESESCWGCFVDGFHGFWEAPTYECAADDPSVPAIKNCTERPEL